MTYRENTLAILHYQPYEKMPIVSFGFWEETLLKWAKEGHITERQAKGYATHGDNSEYDQELMAQLGFDFNWNSCIGSNVGLRPAFETEVLQERPDGSRVIRDGNGLITLVKPGIVSIPAEIGTTLTDRDAWEKLYLPKLQINTDRIPTEALKNIPLPKDRSIPLGLHLGSLMGNMRNMLGVEEFSYLYADDEELFVEIANTLCELCYEGSKAMLESGVVFDYAHYWEDICFKNGPLVNPSIFKAIFGPWYAKISALLAEYGIDIISLDCDGCIDLLVPIWLENGVNTMFPIEVGTWEASIAPWREQYGKDIRGVGGMNKKVFAQDRQAIEREVERLKGLIALGGFIPCPDHRIAPDAEYDLVRYYCELMRKI